MRPGSWESKPTKKIAATCHCNVNSVSHKQIYSKNHSLWTFQRLCAIIKIICGTFRPPFTDRACREEAKRFTTTQLLEVESFCVDWIHLWFLFNALRSLFHCFVVWCHDVRCARAAAESFSNSTTTRTRGCIETPWSSQSHHQHMTVLRCQRA